VLAGVIQNHPNRTVPDFRRKLVRGLACHGSILSGVGASGKPGAVHFDVHPNQITAWKSQLEGSASEIFGSGGGTPAIPAIDVKSLHAKIGELTLENDFLEGALTKAGLLSAKR